MISNTILSAPRRVRRALLVTAGCLALGTQARAATTIAEGWDLLLSDPRAASLINFSAIPGLGVLGPVAFAGLAVSTFDFGGALGVQPVGNTNTIIRRLTAAERGRDRRGGGDVPAADPDEGVIDIELVALSLQSVDPINLLDFGGNLEGARTVDLTDLGGNLTFNFDAMTYDLNLRLRLRLEGVDTNVLTPDFELNLLLENQPWEHDIEEDYYDEIQLPDINFFLNGVDGAEDFYPQNLLAMRDGDTVLNLRAGGIPEPSSGLLLSLAGMLLLGRHRRRTG